MGRVLIIGAGGVGQVVAHKCAQVPEVFSEICLASRTLEKCERIAAQLPRPIQTARVDADNVPELVALIRSVKPELGHQRGASLSGPAYHGCLPGDRSRLSGYGQL